LPRQSQSQSSFPPQIDEPTEAMQIVGFE